ncbi:MAG: hypothetical protein ACRDA7_01495 [Metamycoplasmataceae bacterium]
MSVIGKKYDTVLVDFPKTKTKFIVKKDAIGDVVYNDYLNEILSLDDLKKIRDTIKSNSKLFKLIVQSSEESAKFCRNNSTDYEKTFLDANKLTIEKVGKIAVILKNKILKFETLKLYLETNFERSFEKWYKMYVEFILWSELETFYRETILSISNFRKVTIKESDIEQQTKKTLNFIKLNLMDPLKVFLEEDWDLALKSYDLEFRIRDKKNKAAIPSISKN